MRARRAKATQLDGPRAKALDASPLALADGQIHVETTDAVVQVDTRWGITANEQVAAYLIQAIPGYVTMSDGTPLHRD